MAFKPIQILINAKDDASAVFDKLQTKVAAVGAAILGYFGVKAFVGVIKGAADLEAALSRVQAATGASADEMKLLRKTAEEAGASGRYSAVEAAGALENLAKAGLSAKDAIGTLPAVLSLAAAGDIELGTSAEYITKAINGLGLSFTDAARVADVLAKGANATNTSVSGLAQALSYAAPLANTLGLSLEQTVAIIGKFADAGIDASRAGTALNSIMAQFADPASKFRTELAAASITTVDFNTALHELAKGGPGASRAINAVGTEAGPALRALLNQGVGKLDELTRSLKDSEGSAAAAAKVMQDNLDGAVRGLGRAWEYVTNTLGTPVLPVLTKAAEQLAGSLRAAVNDGTVAKFGTAIATAFQSAIKWVRDFAASFDFGAATAKALAFAERVGAILNDLSSRAKTTSDVVQTAWGVMSTGANVLIAVIFKIGESFAGVTFNILSGVSLIIEGLSKITIGNVSAAFKQAADEIRESAAGMAGVTEAYAKQASAAFDRAAEGAEAASAGWRALTTEADASAVAAAAAEKAYVGMATALQATAQANAVAAEKARATASAQAEQAKKAQEARAAQEELRAEYAQAIATGNVQRAAEVMLKLKAVTDAAAASAENNTKKQEQHAKAIEAAFSSMGLQTKETLRNLADAAQKNFELIRDSGQANADTIAAAWAKAADAAIAANDGVVPAWVAAQAAAKGYEVQVDEAGRATLQLVQTAAALKGLAGGFDNAAKAAQNYGKVVGGVRAPGGGGGAGGSAGGGGGVPGGVRGGRLPDGTYLRPEDQLGVIGPNQVVKSTQVSGEMRSVGTDLGTRTGIAAFLKAAGVDDDAIARKIANEFADTKGDIPFFDNPGQKKYGGEGGTLSMALIKAAEQYTFGTANKKPQTPSTIPQPESTRTVRVDLNLNGQSYGSLNTDSAGADMLQQLLSQIGRARSSASL